ncbi:DUF2179 domain-containing protein [Paenibacillus aurantius]|uniref:DUF2179 domain-containing protein n=1 Tax=Paenibacillus aurantius TaxID=2918900 RepID=A0AA96LBG0_9BACL|nr:DUF2179 domain-containing protein [Paenibacillus aurantius]WNQ10068.1 DUF2179 domain-containing protein [Paenibacillus aurantius]
MIPLYGRRTQRCYFQRMVRIHSERHERIKERLQDRKERSIRPLNSHPMHRSAEEKVLYIVVYRLELVTIRELVRSVDPDAGLTVWRMDHWS